VLVLLLRRNPPLMVTVISSNPRPVSSVRPSLHIWILNNPSNIDLQDRRRRIAMTLLIVCVEVWLRISKIIGRCTFISSNYLFNLSICLYISTGGRHDCVDANRRNKLRILGRLSRSTPATEVGCRCAF
jgi:hypothetical protein